MTDWLEPVRGALEAAAAPVRWFFRDDDGGWDDAALERLLARFEFHGLGVDVAVIPAELTGSAHPLSAWVERGVARVHQHGWSHRSWTVEGRKGEFGDDRLVGAIVDDLVAGRDRMTAVFGAASEPVFTPPWNRCSRTTAVCLRQLGFEVLSREAGAARFEIPGLAEVPVTFDWFAKRHGVAASRAERGETLAAQVRSGEPVGVMLHHAATDTEELDEVDRLLALVAAAPAVVPTSILGEARRQPAT